jgi:hypothetical protein
MSRRNVEKLSAHEAACLRVLRTREPTLDRFSDAAVIGWSREIVRKLRRRV